MLVIRMQRTGRKGHAQFRVVVQDSRRTPTSGRVVAALGSYNPHTKQTILNKEKIKFYLEHGAQPSDRIIRLLKSEKIALPKWISDPVTKNRSTRNAEKLRKNRPAEAVQEENADILSEEPINSEVSDSDHSIADDISGEEQATEEVSDSTDDSNKSKDASSEDNKSDSEEK
ncbi:30S ribosomal protein S16 [Candidatus Saccharibacteria bacterium]|nr:30S ribosomal protein S16 [Candidatus Saccharibacteria bacterium]